MTYQHSRANIILQPITAAVLTLALFIMPMPGAAGAFGFGQPHQRLSAISLAYGRLARDYSLAVKRFGVQATGPATLGVVLGSVSNYLDAYETAASAVPTNFSYWEDALSGVNAVAYELQTATWLSCPYPCTTTEAALIELRTLTSEINVMNGFPAYPYVHTAARLPNNYVSPLGSSVAIQYGQAGYVIGSAFAFCALVFLFPLTTAVAVSIGAGFAIGAASYIFAQITGAQENEFLANISDASDGVFVASSIPGIVTALPPQFQQTVINWIEAVSGVSRTIAKGAVPAIAPISSIWALLVAAAVTQTKARVRGGPPINPPLNPSSGVDTGGPVVSGHYACVTLDNGGETCWYYN